MELNRVGGQQRQKCIIDSCRCDPPDCTKTYGKSLIPSSEALKPKEYQCIWSIPMGFLRNSLWFGAEWTCVWMNNWNKVCMLQVWPSRLYYWKSLIPSSEALKPKEYQCIWALRFQDLRSINASELNERAYEWTTEQGLHVAGGTLQSVPKPVLRLCVDSLYDSLPVAWLHAGLVACSSVAWIP